MKNRRTHIRSALLGALIASAAMAVAAAEPPVVPTPPAPPLPRVPTPPAVPPLQPVLPASAASAVRPMPAIPTPQPAPQSPAVKAAEKSVAPGDLRPEQPVVPQIKVPLKGRNDKDSVRVEPAPGGIVEGTVNDERARCLASSDLKVRASCPNSGPGSAPRKSP